jgi:hypothetical protein
LDPFSRSASHDAAAWAESDPKGLFIAASRAASPSDLASSGFFPVRRLVR